MSDHPIVHIELSAQDPGDAGKFYADLFGWKIESDEAMDYVMFRAEPGPGGGFVKAGEQGMEAGDVLIYVATADIEAALTKAESLGGKTVVRKTEIPNVGWFGVFTDPTGNAVGLFTTKGEQS